MLAYHANDAFECSSGVARLRYYGIASIPVAVFDGKDRVIGGNPGTFDAYHNLYNLHTAVNAPGILSLKVDYNSFSRTGQIVSRLNSVDKILESELHLRYAITESHKFYQWQWLDSLQSIVRDMLPDSLGVSFSVSQGEVYGDTQTFYISSSWVDQNCELVVFVQSDKDTSVLLSNSIPLYQKHVSGDANSDGAVTVSDVVYLTNYVLYSGPEPEPSASGDPNEDCVTDAQDIVYLFDYLFNEGFAPLRGWEID